MYSKLPTGLSVNPAPFIIVEMSDNRNQSIGTCLEISRQTPKQAQMTRIQTYIPDKTMMLDLDEREFHINDPNSLWADAPCYKLYGEVNTPWEWHKPIFDRAHYPGIISFSKLFNDPAVDFLENRMCHATR